MVRLALLKFGLLGTVAIAVVGTADTLPFSWPLVSLLVNVFFLGWGFHAAGSSYVGGLVEPDEDSSRGYIHYFRTCHLLFHRSTTYFTHKSMWRVFLGAKREPGAMAVGGED